jgi:vitamin B12 transporter
VDYRRSSVAAGMAIAAQLVAGVIPSFATPAAAQSPPSITLEPVIVTGTRLPGGIDPDAGNVTVINRETIQARHASSAVELLRALPGVVIEQPGGRGSVVSIFTRGAKPNFTVVMIDGVKVNDPTNTRGGSFDFSTLSLDSIGRIEIVRGPESAIYGSDAVGGVINIITRKGSDQPLVEGEASGGQFAYWRTAAAVRGPVGPATASLGVSHTDNGTPVQGSMFQGTNINGSLGGPLFDGATFEVTGRYGINHAESFPDSSGGPQLAVIRDVDRRNIDEAVVGAHFDQQIASAWSQRLQYGLYDRASSVVSPGVAPSRQDPAGIPRNADNVHFRRQEVTWTHTVTLDPAARLALGANFADEQGVDDGSLRFGKFLLPTHFALDRRVWAGFAEAKYNPVAALELSAGGRYDMPTRAAGHFSPKLAAAYTIEATGSTLRVSWGRGFKLPSFFALGNPIVGDPNLKAETSTSIEGGISQKLSMIPGTLKLTWFDTTYSNLIDFNPGPVPKLVNLSQVHTRGGEASLALQIRENLELSPYLSYTLTRNEQTGASLRDVPRWLAGGNLLWRPTETISLNLGVFRVGPYIDNAIPTGDVRLAGHQRLDLTATWEVRPDVKLYVAVENLFDQHYQEAVGFPAPGFFARSGVLVKF